MNAVIVDVDGTLAEFHPAEVHEWVLGPAKQWDPFIKRFTPLTSLHPLPPSAPQLRPSKGWVPPGNYLCQCQ